MLGYNHNIKKTVSSRPHRKDNLHIEPLSVLGIDPLFVTNQIPVFDCFTVKEYAKA